MRRPLILLVRETPSLADALELLLETVGFRVVSERRAANPLSRVGRAGAEPVAAVVIACNEALSETLERYPSSPSAVLRDTPLIVVGDRPSGTRFRWPPRVRFFPLPLDARALVDHLTELTRDRSAGATVPLEPAAVP